MSENEENLIGDYDKIMSDRNIFNQVVYTPLSDALRLLDERQKDKELMAKIEKLLNGDVPEILKNKKCGVFARQLATPNFDTRSFISIVMDNNLIPVFYEYPEDKFVPENEYKHSLGQLRIHEKIDKSGNFIEEKISIIDFNKYNGKKMVEIKTFWGEPLIEFHRKLFNLYKIDVSNINFINGSNWVNKNGSCAKMYYTNLLLLFVCHGILFENFMMNGTEGDFSAKTVLPAIERIINLTGLKPLIVPIPPMDLEEDSHWVSYDPIIKKVIKNN